MHNLLHCLIGCYYVNFLNVDIWMAQIWQLFWQANYVDREAVFLTDTLMYLKGFYQCKNLNFFGEERGIMAVNHKIYL